MRKAQERMRQARPYSDKIRNIAANLAHGEPRVPVTRSCARRGDAKAVGFIVVTTDKGLCGGLNTNVLRAVTDKMREVQDAGAGRQAVAIGNKGFGFLNRIGANVVSHVDAARRQAAAGQADRPGQGACSTLSSTASSTRSTSCYTRFINTMKQEPVVEQLLPLSAERLAQTAEEKSAYAWDYIYEPDAPTRDRRTADALHRGAGLPGGGREHGVASSARAWWR